MDCEAFKLGEVFSGDCGVLPRVYTSFIIVTSSLALRVVFTQKRQSHHLFSVSENVQPLDTTISGLRTTPIVAGFFRGVRVSVCVTLVGAAIVYGNCSLFLSSGGGNTKIDQESIVRRSHNQG